MNGVPEGFELLSRTSPLVDLLGSFYARCKAGSCRWWRQGCISLAHGVYCSRHFV
jgi:hypothetical protein